MKNKVHVVQKNHNYNVENPYKIHKNLNDEQFIALTHLLDDKLRKEFRKWNNNHIDAIRTYANNSKEINTALLFNNRKQKSIKRPIIINLDKALASHKLTESIQVFSGLGFTPESYAFHSYEKYIKVFVPCYMSTSTSENVASGFGTSGEALTRKSRHVYVRVEYRKNYQTYKAKYKKLSYQEWKSITVHDTETTKGYKDYNNVKDKIIKKYEKKWGINNYKTSYHNKTIIDLCWFKHIMRIEVPRNSHGGYIASHSSHSGEYEYIIPRNSIIKVEPVPYVDFEDECVRWHGKLIFDGTRPTNCANWNDINKYSKRKFKLKR